jgi:putative membrane protein
LILAVGVTLATKLVPGITCSDGTTLFVVVVVLSLFNAILKPLLLLFTLPFIIMTLGLGVVLINALLFYWTGRLVEGFHVANFGSAFWGGVIVSLTNLIAGRFIRSPSRPVVAAPAKPAKRDDVIDI